ncbi:hypothetical protein [Natrarchaeobius chitinivorans]|uniref:Uncharacterized protein n=1 Tax=Natrarchaeobius chitinivorans TaxID=1679083 RepID=A0A3N6NB69_NATCH|nr:hypothetical protein [Natrarchaeobius chitinivorans]RQG95862.1 hypothetical protein EA473_06640 [Natrarchaeobius chitinivorans]
MITIGTAVGVTALAGCGEEGPGEEEEETPANDEPADPDDEEELNDEPENGDEAADENGDDL